MSHPIPWVEQELPEAFDWHLSDIVNKAPYSPYDMVLMLSEGKFIIEGKVSTHEDAQYYCDEVDDKEAWDALKALEQDELAISGPLVY